MRKIINSDPKNFVFIIGAMKSGTTSLFDILSQHPEICPCNVKEPDYFVKNPEQETRKNYLDLYDWNPGVHSIALEASVAYTKEPYIRGVPERIKVAGLGEYRFIYMLRNPLDRIESHIRHGIFSGWGESLDKGVPKDALHYSSYAMQLEKFLDFFPREHIMLFTLEEFKENPNVVLNRTCRFLKIDPNFKFKDVHSVRNSGNFFSTSRSVASITQSNISQFIARKILPGKLKVLLRNTITKLFSSNGKAESEEWRLTPADADYILKFLENDLIELEINYKIDIQKYWNIDTDKFNKIR